MHQSMSLKYEPSSKPLRNSARELLLNQELPAHGCLECLSAHQPSEHYQIASLRPLICAGARWNPATCGTKATEEEYLTACCGMAGFITCCRSVRDLLSLGWWAAGVSGPRARNLLSLSRLSRVSGSRARNMLSLSRLYLSRLVSISALSDALRSKGSWPVVSLSPRRCFWTKGS